MDHGDRILMFKLIAALTLCLSASAYETYGAWEGVSVSVDAQGSRRFRNIVKQSMRCIEQATVAELESGKDEITIKRGNTFPYWGWTLLVWKNGRIVGAEITITNQLKLKGAELCALRLIIVHELLHAIGLGHSEDRNSIMFPVIHGDQQITADDVQGVAFLYGG